MTITDPLQAAFNWIWTTFGETAVKGSLDWGWTAAQWKRAADRYSERLEEDYGKLFVLGQATPRDIDDIYTYVHVLEKISADKRYGREKLEAYFMARGLFHESDERRDGMNVVRRNENLFLLGQPGAGKTTFLKQVTMQAIHGNLARTIETPWRDSLPEQAQAKIAATQKINPIPVFIALKEHADSGRTLLESVKYELAICRFPDNDKTDVFVQYLLSSGGGIVLWDGLDEVSSDGDRRGRLVLEMHDFMRQYRETQFIITCRVAAAEYSFDNVTYLEMADFDQSQMKQFIYRWFDDDQKLAKQCWQELAKAENEGLRELARIPLLLTLLAITYEETLTFPQRRVEIYEEAIDALLKKWDSKRRIQRGEEPYKALSLGRKRQMLATIGAETFGEGKFILPQRELATMIETYMQKVPKMEEDVDGEAVLRSIAARHGMFVERAHDLFSFAHLSFQEYFAAKYIVNNTRQGTLERLLNHIDDTQWREVFLLTASLLEEADAEYFFTLFIAQLNDRVADVESIQKLLQWAMEKQVAYSRWDTQDRKEKAVDTMRVKRTVYERLALRAWYHSRVLALAGTLTRHRSSALVRGLDLDRSLAFDRALNRAYDLEYIRARTINLALDLDLNRVLDLDRVRSFGLDEFANQLKVLSAPDKDASNKKWKHYASNLRQLIDEFRDLTGINYLSQSVTEEDKAYLDNTVWDRLSNDVYTAYLNGMALLVDCLKLAMVGNRKEIETHLLLPA